MQNTQSNDSTGATQNSLEWIHVTINRSCSAPPPVVKQERRSPTQESQARRIPGNASPTSSDYSGPPKREVAHASMSWTGCFDDGCQIHLSEKQGSSWYPQFTRGSRKPSVAHDHYWRQEIEANPGEDWGPQQPGPGRARRAYHEIMSWDDCFNDECNDHRWDKVDAGYFSRQVGEKGTLSKNKRREHKKRNAMRTRLGREESEKPFETWRLWRDKFETSEANSIALPKSLWQKATTSNDSTRRRKNSNKPTIEPNRGCAKSEPRCGKNQFSIVGLMPEREGSNVTNSY